MVGGEPFKQLIRKFCAKFFPLVCHNVLGSTNVTVTLVKNGICNCVCFFVWQRHQLNIFCVSICHAQNKLFVHCHLSLKGRKVWHGHSGWAQLAVEGWRVGQAVSSHLYREVDICGRL